MSTIWILRFTCLLQIASMGILFVFEAVRLKDGGVGENIYVAGMPYETFGIGRRFQLVGFNIDGSERRWHS